jgi:hypothetical protein
VVHNDTRSTECYVIVIHNDTQSAECYVIVIHNDTRSAECQTGILVRELCLSLLSKFFIWLFQFNVCSSGYGW